MPQETMLELTPLFPAKAVQSATQTKTGRFSSRYLEEAEASSSVWLFPIQLYMSRLRVRFALEVNSQTHKRGDQCERVTKVLQRFEVENCHNTTAMHEDEEVAFGRLRDGGVVDERHGAACARRIASLPNRSPAKCSRISRGSVSRVILVITGKESDGSCACQSVTKYVGKTKMHPGSLLCPLVPFS
ncbi:hypothetical protein BC830DRAFT_1218481 [Chytriomyces sp. MP71]|nr:hypothetical protein BC830DRAFT_1218481 [Chytriomyces sp. MP71]